MEKIKEYVIIFGIGSVAYALVEVLFRGHTHWTMLLTGGLVFSFLYFIFGQLGDENILKIAFLGGAVITTAEYSVGCIVNLALNMNVWNYSRKPFNLFGQICPAFSLGWVMISIPVFYISLILKKRIS